MKKYKRLSKSGSINIPVQLRREYGIRDGDAFEIDVSKDGTVLLKPHVPRCVFCGGTEDVMKMNGKGICPECVLAAKEAIMKEVKGNG